SSCASSSACVFRKKAVSSLDSVIQKYRYPVALNRMSSSRRRMLMIAFSKPVRSSCASVVDENVVLGRASRPASAASESESTQFFRETPAMYRMDVTSLCSFRVPYRRLRALEDFPG
ncbi:hypothetical protein DIPPA_21449, partial [Diplonema papillatum]